MLNLQQPNVPSKKLDKCVWYKALHMYILQGEKKVENLRLEGQYAN